METLSVKEEKKSDDLRVMEIVPQFDYLIKIGESITIAELQHRAQFCPGIMEEPELQELVQLKQATIKAIERNHAGYWYHFLSPEVEDINVRQELRVLTIVKNCLVDARFQLGANTRFKVLAEMIENAILEASRQEIAADDYINERC